jgi:phosphinothricin acetyltransferase
MNTIARNDESTIRIRLATLQDAGAICDIYTPYVLTTAITFDITEPSVEEMSTKIETVLKERPFLVAEKDGEILGFAYASAFRPREAYVHAIETSVYIRQDYKAKGLGRRLYTALEDILRLQHVYTANACISYIEPPDEYSPATSRLFHERMGYKQCAHIPNCGRKFNRWYGIIWMQKQLAPLPETPEDFIALPSLEKTALESILSNA